MKKNTTTSSKRTAAGSVSSETAQETNTASTKTQTPDTTTEEQDDENAKTIKDVFEGELKDIYGAEQQLLKALPEVAEAASTDELKQAVNKHLEQTKEHVKRIEKVFSLLSIDREAKKCKAMEGLIEEGKEIIKEFGKGVARDCALIIGSQKIEHYEIAAYGSLCELAEVMGKHRVAEILDQTLEEEEQTDKILTRIAERVNDEAMAKKERSKESKLTPA